MTTSLTGLKYSCHRYKTFFWKVRHVFAGKNKKTYTFEGLKFMTEGEKKKIILAFKAPFSR